LLCRLIGGFFMSAEALESAYFSRCPQEKDPDQYAALLQSVGEQDAQQGASPNALMGAGDL
jgi:hypothetical protein